MAGGTGARSARPVGSHDPIGRVRSLRRRGRLREAVSAVSAALGGPAADQAAVSVRMQAAMLFERGELLALLGDDVPADVDLAEAARRARAVDSGIASRAMAARAALARVDGRLEAASDLVDEAVRIMAADPAIEPLARSEVHRESGLLGIDRNEPAAGDALDRAVILADGAPDGPERDRALALALEGRAAARRIAGDFGLARSDLDRALTLARRACGRSSLEVAQILNARGMIGKFSGDFTRAAADYGRAAAIIEAVLGSDHLEMSAVLHNVAGLAHARGAFADAEVPARQSLEIRLRVLGEAHVAVALDRSGLASILDRLGWSDEADALLRLALPVLRASLGATHREVAVALNNHAAVAQARGDLETAEERYRESLAIKEATLGSAAPSVGITLSNLATVVRRRGDLATAGDLADRAIAILDGTLPPHHPIRRAAAANRERIRTATAATGSAASASTEVTDLSPRRHPRGR